MSEPTKEAIEEAAVLAETFQITHRNWDDTDDKRLAKIISIIRIQATNDALERAALHFDNYRSSHIHVDDADCDIRAMNDSVYLKLCPFCGAAPEITRQGNDFTKKRRIVIRCPSCRVERADAAIRNDMEWLERGAIEQWNERAPNPDATIPA